MPGIPGPIPPGAPGPGTPLPPAPQSHASAQGKPFAPSANAAWGDLAWTVNRAIPELLNESARYRRQVVSIIAGHGRRR